MQGNRGASSLPLSHEEWFCEVESSQSKARFTFAETHQTSKGFTSYFCLTLSVLQNADRIGLVRSLLVLQGVIALTLPKYLNIIEYWTFLW